MVCYSELLTFVYIVENIDCVLIKVQTSMHATEMKNA